MKNLPLWKRISLILMAGLFCGALIMQARSSKESPKSSSPGRVTVCLLSKDGTLEAPKTVDKVVHTEAEWMKILTPEQFRILRSSGTERPFCGGLLKNKSEGVYVCAGCGLPLFRSQSKFESGTGWPSFYEPVARENIAEVRDVSHGMERTEINCALCDGHLGHVFNDGPPPTGLRYCLNSEAMKFVGTPKPKAGP
ncbi:MAG: peptide-methionine (R)-S-oxide reductase MsrB [Verrucomicrobiae bacterium]|nr:peptide-methionine (R)-S-oxide reductase MsrB [Verrucomicrobiae bacterium]